MCTSDDALTELSRSPAEELQYQISLIDACVRSALNLHNDAVIGVDERAAVKKLRLWP